MSEEYVPSLTLDPNAAAAAAEAAVEEEAPVVEEEKVEEKEVPIERPELEKLSPAEQAAVKEFSEKIDVLNTEQVMNYYLPTTIKLLNSYDRMSSVGVEGENLDKSMKNINDMLDAAIVAYKKRLDSLFANQALDIETDIEVMNTMLEREGLKDENDFQVQQSGSV